MSKYRTFKGVERQIAKRLGGKRVGHLGGADVIVDSWLSIEVKSRKQIPQWIRDALNQSKRNAGISELPIVILHQVGQNHNGDIVILTLADFQNWFGQAGDSGDSGVVADAEKLASQGDGQALEWLSMMRPDRQDGG